MADTGGLRHTVAVSIEVRPATVFDDVATLVGPEKPTSKNACTVRERGNMRAAETRWTLDGFPRVLMRLDLRK